jgi:tRNA 2-thiouridine synthesizing protein A
MNPELPSADRSIDTRGLLCPLPTVKASLLLEEMAAGQILELLADDSVTKRDLPEWCRSMGHKVLGIKESASDFRIYIKKKG